MESFCVGRCNVALIMRWVMCQRVEVVKWNRTWYAIWCTCDTEEAGRTTYGPPFDHRMTTMGGTSTRYSCSWPALRNRNDRWGATDVSNWRVDAQHTGTSRRLIVSSSDIHLWWWIAYEAGISWVSASIRPNGHNGLTSWALWVSGDSLLSYALNL